MVENQLPQDSVPRARGAKQNLVSGRCGWCPRANVLHRGSDSVDSGRRHFPLDEDWQRVCGIGYPFYRGAMVPRDHWAAQAAPATRIGQDAQGCTDLGRLKVAAHRVQRVPADRT